MINTKHNITVQDNTVYHTNLTYIALFFLCDMHVTYNLLYSVLLCIQWVAPSLTTYILCVSSDCLGTCVFSRCIMPKRLRKRKDIPEDEQSESSEQEFSHDDEEAVQTTTSAELLDKLIARSSDLNCKITVMCSHDQPSLGGHSSCIEYHHCIILVPNLCLLTHSR